MPKMDRTTEKQKIVDGDVGGDREEKKPADDEVGIELRSFVLILVNVTICFVACRHLKMKNKGLMIRTKQ